MYVSSPLFAYRKTFPASTRPQYSRGEASGKIVLKRKVLPSLKCQTTNLGCSSLIEHFHANPSSKSLSQTAHFNEDNPFDSASATKCKMKEAESQNDVSVLQVCVNLLTL